MTNEAFIEMKRLRDGLAAEPIGIEAELTTFPSGGAMLDVRRAGRALQRGLTLAARLAMPYDQAVAHHGLAAAIGGDHAMHARRLFTRLGCRWHLSAPSDYDIHPAE